MCYYCNVQKETVIHFFFQCKAAQAILKEICEYLSHTYQIKICSLTHRKILFNNVDENLFSFVNLIFCITKQMMYALKCMQQKVTASRVIEELEFIHQTEYKRAIVTNNCKRYNLTWPDKIQVNSDESVL